LNADSINDKECPVQVQNKKYDAVVVGAGINGLAAAVHLATKGWSVLLLEKSDMAGGAVKTRELTLPGFRHDLYAMNLSMFAGSPFFAEHQQLLVEHGLRLCPAERTFASAFPDGSLLGVERDLEATAGRIQALSAKDARRWRQLVAAFGADAPPLFQLLAAPMPSLALLRVLWRAWRDRGTAWIAGMVRLLTLSPRAWLDRHFENDQLKTTLAVWGMHLDFPPDMAGGALFPYLESMACQSAGIFIGQGGADTVIKAMLSAFRALGGDVLLETEASEILTQGGHAYGVLLADGRRMLARRSVIANLGPKVLYGTLLKSANASARRQRERFRHGPGTMMIHLALDALPQWSAGAELQQYAYVHLAPSMEAMTAAYAEAVAGLLPRVPVIVVGQASAVDPSRAPPGKHVLWIQVRVLPATVSGDAAGEIAGTQWDNIKEAYADRVLALLETYAPGLSQNVLARVVLSPQDLERDNPNLVGGDSLGGSHHLDQNLLFRPAFGYSRYRTPVAGLYMVGASTWPGAGTGAGSGFLCAQLLARSQRKEG
jgi:phytoene dehydrogenase-like protein